MPGTSRETLNGARRPDAGAAPRGPLIYVVAAQRVHDFVAAEGPASFLSERELRALDGLALEQRRWDWLAGRVAAKALLARTLADASGWGAETPALRDIEIGYDADGAPCFTVAGRPGVEREWSISISHDDGHAACAVGHLGTTGRVGVDLERDRPLEPELLRYFLSVDERRRVRRPASARAPRAVTPIALWAVKEAVIKAAPGRTRGSMWNVDLTWDEAGLISVALPDSDAGPRIDAGFERRGGHVIAYATSATYATYATYATHATRGRGRED